MQKPQPTNSASHRFFTNAKENTVKPPWFIDCERREAESILLKHSDSGSVLIRPNSSFLNNGSYALSSCTTVQGETKFVHYVISRVANGFKLEVQSKPPAMTCLKDVVDYYIHAAGSAKHRAMTFDPTMTSNEKSVYVNIPNVPAGPNKSSSKDEEDYLPMNGRQPNPIIRRCSAPNALIAKKDYINLPNCNKNNVYLNESSVKTNCQKGGQECHDYINMNNVVPGHNSKRSQSFRDTGKTNSLPEYVEEDSSDDEAPNYLAPPPPFD